MSNYILIIFVFFIGCDMTPEENLLEIELKEIQEGELVEDLKQKEFKNFVIDWENPMKYESSCEDYYLIPRKDTFDYQYYLDCCYGKYQWSYKIVKRNQNQSEINIKDCARKVEMFHLFNNEYEQITSEFYKNKIDGLYYLLSCDVVGTIITRQLKYNIDFDTYKKQGRYFKDKNAVYLFYPTSGGTRIEQLSADVNTFQFFENSIYAKDKDNIYTSSSEIIQEADVETFEVLDYNVARDKDHYYHWNEITNDTSLINDALNNDDLDEFKVVEKVERKNQ